MNDTPVAQIKVPTYRCPDCGSDQLRVEISSVFSLPELEYASDAPSHFDIPDDAPTVCIACETLGPSVRFLKTEVTESFEVKAWRRVCERARAYSKSCEESHHTDTGTLWELVYDLVGTGNSVAKIRPAATSPDPVFVDADATDRPTDDQVSAVVGRIIDNPGPRWPGQSFEDGVRAALDWVQGHAEHDPLHYD